MINEYKQYVTLQSFLNNPNIFDKFKKSIVSANKRLLDIGCGLPGHSAIFQKCFLLDEVYLVDLRNELECLQYGLKDVDEKVFELVKSSKSIWEWYEKISLNGYLDVLPIKVKNKIETEKKFNEIFKLHMGSDITDFFEENDKMYDVVLAINIFHLLDQENAKNVFIKSKARLKSEGLYFIRYQGDGQSPNDMQFRDLVFELFETGSMFYFPGGFFFVNSTF